MDLKAIVMLLVQVSIVLNVVGIGLRASFSDATFLFRQPALLARAVLSMNILMPLIAILLARLLPLQPVVKIALVTLSISPVPPIFPKRASKLGGKNDYVIGLLVAMGTLSVFFIPVVMEICEKVFNMPLAMSSSEVLAVVLTTILVPLLVGIALRKFVPKFADRVADPLSKIAFLLLLLCLVPILIGVAKPAYSLIGNGTLLVFAIFASAGFAVGHLLGGPAAENRTVLALSSSTPMRSLLHPQLSCMRCSVRYFRWFI